MSDSETVANFLSAFSWFEVLQKRQGIRKYISKGFFSSFLDDETILNSQFTARLATAVPVSLTQLHNNTNKIASPKDVSEKASRRKRRLLRVFGKSVHVLTFLGMRSGRSRLLLGFPHITASRQRMELWQEIEKTGTTGGQVGKTGGKETRTTTGTTKEESITRTTKEKK